MRRLLIAVVMVMAAGGVGEGVAEAATVYAKGIGGTVYYESGAASCDAVTAADTAGDLEAALTAAGAGGTLNICAGTYTGTMIDAADGLDTTANAQTINGAGRDLTIIDITGVADSAFSATHTSVVVKNLTLKGSSGTNYCFNRASSTDFTLEDVTLGPGTRLIFSNAGGVTSTITRTKFVGATDTTWHGYLQGTGQTVNINYSQFLGNAGDFGVTSGTVNFNNTNWSGGTKRVINLNSGTPTVNINNGIIAGMYGSTADIIKATAGTVNINDSIYLPNWYSATGSTSVTTGSVNFDAGVINKSPRWFSPKYPAIIVVGIDDYANLAHWLDVADAATARGIKTTYALNLASTGELSAADKTAIRARMAQGHEVVAHSKSHVPLTEMTAFTLGHATATAGITVDQSNANSALWTGTLDLSTGESFDLTDYTLGTLETAVEAVSGYTMTFNDNVSAYKNSIPAITLAAVGAGTSLNPARAMQFNETARLHVELKDGKALLESELGTTIYSLVYPGNYEDSDTITAAKAYFPNGGAREGTSGDTDLSAMEIYKLYGYLASASNIGTDNTKAHVHSMVEYARAFGRVVALYDHTAAAFSVADWIDVFDALNEAGATVMTLTEAVNYIKANGSTADSGLTYTRTLVDASDYRLTASSPAINAGVDVGLTTDFLGNPIKGLPDIGAYEFQGGVTRFPSFITFPSFPTFGR